MSCGLKGANITDALDTYQKESLYHGITGERINTATDGLYKPTAELVATLDVDAGFDALDSSFAANILLRQLAVRRLPPQRHIYMRYTPRKETNTSEP